MKEIVGIKEVDIRGDRKTFETRLGIAHECEDGSLRLMFDYFPTKENVRIEVREKIEREHDEGVLLWKQKKS